MKTIRILSLVSYLVLLTLTINAQENTPKPKPLIIQTMYLDGQESNQRVNVDSLLKIWKQRIMDPNPYFESTKIVTHWWGKDSREVVFIYVLKSWSDLEKSFEKRNEIIKEHKGWTDAEAKEFGKVWRSLFSGHHSDEIYRVVAE